MSALQCDPPVAWRRARFDEIASVDSNLVDPGEFGDYPHIAPNNIESDSGRLLPFRSVAEDEVISGKHRFFPGHILYSKIRPNLNKVTVADFDGLCSADMYPISTSQNTRWLWLVMLSPEFVLQTSGSQTRTVLPKINMKELSKVELLVPPLEEQERIVEVLEEHLSRLDATLASIQTVRDKAAQFRRSLLHAAFRMEDAEVRPLGELATLSLGKMLDRKQQTGLHPTPYLRNINVRWHGVELDDLQEMDISPEHLERVSLREGDVVVCEGGEPGRTAVWEGSEPIAIQKALHRVRPSDAIDPGFLAYLFEQEFRGYGDHPLFTGTTIKHLPKEKIAQVPVPVVPVDVQKATVAALESQLSHIDAMLVAADRVEAQCAALRRSMLHAAFTGKLTEEWREAAHV